MVRCPQALPALKALGAPWYVHAELVSDCCPPQGDPRAYQTYLATRPPAFERDAIAAIIAALDADADNKGAEGFAVHVAHLADAGCLDMLHSAAARHPLSVETCPHYLTFSAEQVPDGRTEFKCAPPIRDAANQAQLIAALGQGRIQLVGSDHSPAPPTLKAQDTGTVSPKPQSVSPHA